MKPFSLRLYVLLALATLLPCPLFAQKDEDDNGPVGIFESRNEYHEFMGSFKQAAQSNPEMRALVPLINDVVLEKPIGWTGERYGGTTSNLGLLSNPDVRESIEMVDDQYKELEKVNSQIQKRLVEQIREFDFSGKTKDEIGEKIREMQQAANDELESLLLPHQTHRLGQIYTQSQLRRRTLGQLLTSDPVKTDLEITDPQAEKLLESEKEIEEDLQKQIAKLREEARGKLLSQLKPEQKEKAEELIGEMFEFSKKEDAQSKKKGKSKKAWKGKVTKK